MKIEFRDPSGPSSRAVVGLSIPWFIATQQPPFRRISDTDRLIDRMILSDIYYHETLQPPTHLTIKPQHNHNV
jgi:hypothetical protein